MRENPKLMREDVRKLTQQKLDVIERQISELNILRQELQELIGSCTCSQQGCPIIEEIEGSDKAGIREILITPPFKKASINNPKFKKYVAN
jgi:hypothetical protein